MCSATMGAEGSVTLELREGVEAPHTNEQSNAAALTLGYSGSDLIESIKAGKDFFFFDFWIPFIHVSSPIMLLDENGGYKELKYTNWHTHTPT